MEATFCQPLQTKGKDDRPLIKQGNKVVSLNLDNTAMFSEMIEEKNEVYIPIWKEYEKCLPFGALQSRNVAATVLSYLGSND